MIKIGIDYGTTTTLVSYTNQDSFSPEPRLIDIGGNRIGYESRSIPSVIAVSKDRISFGYAAEQQAINNRDVILLRSLKRCLSCEGKERQVPGVCLNAANFQYCIGGQKFSLFNKTYSLHDLLLPFLDSILNQSLTNIRGKHSEVSAVGISVPAIFGDSPRRSISNIILNIIQEKKSIEVINEPTAAIMACKNRDSDIEDGVYVVCDVGGGTTDIVVFEKKTTGGMTKYFLFKPSGCRVAGDDVDSALLKYLLPNRQVTEQNLQEARKAKEHLTLSKETTVFGKKLTRSDLQEIVKPVLLKIVESLREEIKVVFDSYAPYSETRTRFEIKGIFLSGGGSKIPYLKVLVEQDAYIREFGPFVDYIRNDKLSAIYSSEDLPIFVVALGASLPKKFVADSLQYMLPYEIRYIDGTTNKVVAPIYSELPLEFVIRKQHNASIRLIAVDPNDPDKAVFDLNDLYSLNDQKEFSAFIKPHGSLKITIDKYNIMRVTAIDAAKPYNRPFELPWQGGIETAMFEKYRRKWRREHGYS